jgi:nucleotide-binding universal stress UspA family protein
MANVWTNRHLRRILVGYDASADSEKALEVALALGDSTNGKVLVLAVARPSEPETSGKAAALLNGAREQLERMLSQLRDRVQRHGIKIETQVAAGHPAEAIISKVHFSLSGF